MNLSTLACLTVGIAATLCTPAFAMEECELQGKPISLNNGDATQGKSGIVRCHDSGSHEILREQELRNGRTMGVMRYFKGGLLEREYSVNERGNREGVSREWNVDGGKRVLIREESFINSRKTGIVRTWYPSGQRRSLGYYGDDEREQASVEYTMQGKLSGLRCAPQPVFGNEFDEKTACGHGRSPSTVELFNGDGNVSSRFTFERGERRKVETLWGNGSVRELRETNASGGLEQSFSADGTKRRERQWVKLVVAPDEQPRNVTTLEQEFHESGKLTQERKWVVRDRDGELVSESHWYLNGQLKDRSEFATSKEQRVRRDTSFYDNGKPSSDGNWLLKVSRSSRSDSGGMPIGSHKSFDEQGRLRVERLFDDKGRLTRERNIDENGSVVRDDEVFEDGSRKSAVVKSQT